ncbi:MAG: hypothetical protein AAF570_24015 [Bacteroidota bacterium]
MSQNVQEMDAMVLQGQIPQAVDRFFHPEAVTKEGDGGTTNSKGEAMTKLTGFVGSIAKVNQIKLHNQAVQDNVTFSEFTFDFDMQDGSKIHWHEVIRREWRDGMVVAENYFQN